MTTSVSVKKSNIMDILSQHRWPMTKTSLGNHEWYMRKQTFSRAGLVCVQTKWRCLCLKAYCTPLYTVHLWSNYKKASLRRLQVAYNDAMRILLKRPSWTSAREIFVAAGVNTFKAVLRNLMFKFICRVDDSKNEIIMLLSNIKFSTTHYQSQLWRHWYSCLFITHV